MGISRSDAGKLAVIPTSGALNGFFVAAEFALVKIRSSQLEAAGGGREQSAVTGQLVTGDLDAYLGLSARDYPGESWPGLGRGAISRAYARSRFLRSWIFNPPP